MAIFMSLLRSGLQWNRFGDKHAITCYADALVKGRRKGRNQL